MNKKVKELIRQATVTQYSDTMTRSETFDKEKFAELLIQECEVALSPMLRDMVSRGQTLGLIKQHFGVE